MPTYEYQCDACGTVFEKFQSITAAPEKKCVACGKNKAKRLIGTGAGLIFKGSGFYITDYRDKSYADKAKAETGGGSAGATDGKSDAKPATGAEAKPAASSTDAKPAAAVPKPDPKPAASKKQKK